MSRFLVITVDTEADWVDRQNRITSIQGLRFLQEICDRYGMIPSYLVTYEMATREEAIRVIKEYLDQGKCEVGHHMHIWSTPPFEDCNAYGVDEKWIEGIQSEIPDHAFSEKMRSLHHAIEKNYGVRPVSHRAGRWGIDKRTLLWLAKSNYLVDSSICPRMLWTEIKGIREDIKTAPYFAPNAPYYPDCEDITREATTKERMINVLEVPVTGINGDFLSKMNLKGRRRLRATLYRFGYAGTENMSFRPSIDLPMNVFQKLTHTVFQSDLPVINLMFHSSELTVGTSPYSRDEDLLKRLKRRIKFVLRTAEEYGIKGITLSEVPKYLADQQKDKYLSPTILSG
jgi:hypothetical protein